MADLSWLRADWYKYRRKLDGRPLDQAERRSLKWRIYRTLPSQHDEALLRKDRRQWEDAFREEWSRGAPEIPGFPVLEFLARSIFYWYVPACWAVDLEAPDWLDQLARADVLNSFSYSECEAYAEREGLEIGPLERLFLRAVTREGRSRSAPRRPHSGGLPYVLEDYSNPRLVKSAELERSLALSKEEVKAERRLTREELACGRRKGRATRREFTPGGALRWKYGGRRG